MTQNTEHKNNLPRATVTPKIFRDVDAARYLGVSEITLRQWRCKLKGPQFIKLGSRAIGYRVSDLDIWVESRAVMTSGA